MFVAYNEVKMKSDGSGLVDYENGLSIYKLLEVGRMKSYHCDHVKFPLNNMTEAVQI